MKATFFTLATMATAAFAAPAPAVQERQLGLDNLLGGLTGGLQDVLSGDLGLQQIIEKVTGAVGSGDLPGAEIPDASEAPETPGSPDELISLLEGVLSGLTGNLDAINSTTDSFQAGDITADAASSSAEEQLSQITEKLSTLVISLTDAGGIPLKGSDLDRVLELVKVLVLQLLTTVNGLVTILGIRPQLASILGSVFTLLTGVVALLIGIAGTLVPGLVAGLSPLLAGLGNGVLAPLLTGVAGLLAGIAPPAPGA